MPFSHEDIAVLEKLDYTVGGRGEQLLHAAQIVLTRQGVRIPVDAENEVFGIIGARIEI